MKLVLFVISGFLACLATQSGFASTVLEDGQLDEADVEALWLAQPPAELETSVVRPQLVITVHKSGTQYLDAKVDGKPVIVNGKALKFLVSTGIHQTVTTASGRRYMAETSEGTFPRPGKAAVFTVRAHMSKSYGVVMRNAVFFNNGEALHATAPENYKYLGRRASHGCVRMTLAHSKIIFDLVNHYGPLNTRVVVLP